MGAVFRLMGIGWYVALCIAGGTLIGVWLDGRLDLSPLLTLVGLGLGIVLALIGMYRMLMAVISEAPGPKEPRKR